MNKTTDLLIIGGGPAGMSATESATELGLAVTVIDEQGAPGGQFLRQPPATFSVGRWLEGNAYTKGKNLLKRAQQSPHTHWLMNTTVAGILPGNPGDPHRFKVVVDSDKGSATLAAHSVLVAAGCYDLPVVFPGWNTPGVMAAGGVQAFIKSQQFVPGEKFVLAGSHPLQLIIADQIVQAGGAVAAVLFSQSRSRVLQLIRQPGVAWRHADKLIQTLGILRRLKQAGVPVRFNQTVTAAMGAARLDYVETAAVDAGGQLSSQAQEPIECDRLGVCFSFLTSAELPRQAGADCTWNARRGGWIVNHDEWMSSSIPGLFVAGETTGVAGSDVAMEEGKLAALGCALHGNRITAVDADALSRPIRRKLKHLNVFADALSRLSWPGDEFFDQLMTGESTLCKCEEISVAHLRQLLQQNPSVSTSSSAKLLSRAGMGLCQGRYCQYSLIRLLAQVRGIPAAEAGGFTARFPSKPLPISNLVDMSD